MGKHFTKLVKFVNNFTKFVEFANNFMKFLEFPNNFTEFVGLASDFCKVCKNRKNFLKFVHWKFGFKSLKVFLYLSFTCSNILIGKDKCIMNNFMFYEYFSQIN